MVVAALAVVRVRSFWRRHCNVESVVARAVNRVARSNVNQVNYGSLRDGEGKMQNLFKAHYLRPCLVTVTLMSRWWELSRSWQLNCHPYVTVAICCITRIPRLPRNAGSLPLIDALISNTHNRRNVFLLCCDMQLCTPGCIMYPVWTMLRGFHVVRGTKKTPHMARSNSPRFVWFQIDFNPNNSNAVQVMGL